MRNTILAAVILFALTFLTVAQDTKPLIPPTLVGAGFAHGRQDSSEALRAKSPSAPFFCKGTTCLYYSGDYDTTSPNNNGLFDFDNPGVGITDAEVWVAVKPKKTAIVTGTAGVYFMTDSAIGINPTPFAIQTGITAGHAGKTVCKTYGNAIWKPYGAPNAINSAAYYIQKLQRGCILKKGKIYFITMQPQYNDSYSIGYLTDDDGGHQNKQGWPEIVDDSYFNSTSFGAVYEPTWGSDGACGGYGCDGFSVALNGRQR